MSGVDFEYAIKKDVRNNPIVRELDEERARQPARCAFIARYHWLRAQLGIDEARLPRQSCDRFQAWLKELKPDADDCHPAPKCLP